MQDLYNFRNYIHRGDTSYGPPLLHTRSRLILAVVQDNVDIVRDLLEPKWYNVIDFDGYNLLQIAILRESHDVFDYILSLEDFPFDFVNKYGATAMWMSLTATNDTEYEWVSERFARELIKKDFDVNEVNAPGDTLLHCALDRNDTEMALSLIQKGVDIHKRSTFGLTALSQVLREGGEEYETELVAALLVFGADPFDGDEDGYSLFELAILRNDVPLVQDLLFLYTHENDTDFTIHLNVILKLGNCNNDLLLRLLERPMKVVLDDSRSDERAEFLLSKDIDNLSLIIDKYSNLLVDVLSRDVYLYSFHSVSIRNFGILLESDLQTHTVDFIQNLIKTPIIDKDLTNCKMDADIGSNLYTLGTYEGTAFNHYIISINEKTVTELYTLALSYGLDIYEFDLQRVYHRFGFCELFRIMLHMDITMELKTIMFQKHAVACLMYDVGFDLNRVLNSYWIYYTSTIYELLYYFADSRLKELCLALYASKPSVLALVQNAAIFPNLQELARNQFRKYLIERFRVTRGNDFYNLVKRLPISSHHMKIITYETKLYTLQL